MMRVKLMYIINIKRIQKQNPYKFLSMLGVIILYDHLKKKKKKKKNYNYHTFLNSYGFIYFIK